MDNNNMLSTEGSSKNNSKIVAVRGGGNQILMVILLFVALGGVAYSAISWQQNQSLKSDVKELKGQVDSLKSVETTKPAKALEGKVGTKVDTKIGSLLVTSYSQTSLHDVASSYTSTEKNVLKVRLTITNTTSQTQTYSASDFAFVNSLKVQVSNINKSFEVVGYTDFLDSTTLEPGGKVETNMFYDKYEGKAGTLKWANFSGQETRISLPAL